MTRRLVVMVKEPRPGRVKTRLAKGIGPIRAAWWYRHQSQDLIRRVSGSRWQIILAVSPDIEGLQSRIWPQHVRKIPQGSGNLGDRMGRILHRFAPDPTIIVGSDIPDIRKHHIEHAFRQLEASDAVIGPAPDGGFWLIGLRGSAGRQQKLFANVRWSTRHARQDTRIGLKGLRIREASELNDVDDVSDM